MVFSNAMATVSGIAGTGSTINWLQGLMVTFKATDFLFPADPSKAGCVNISSSPISLIWQDVLSLPVAGLHCCRCGSEMMSLEGVLAMYRTRLDLRKFVLNMVQPFFLQRKIMIMITITSTVPSPVRRILRYSGRT